MRFQRWGKLLAQASVLALLAAAPASGIVARPAIAAAGDAVGKRLALVVGNSNYRSVYDLKNAVNDSDAVAEVLERLGFEVTTVDNAGQKEFRKAIDDFARSAKDADATLFYYSGHGFQMKGVNYLVPTDASLKNAQAIEKETLRLDAIIAELQSRDRQTLIFLDACRNNPLPEKLREKNSEGLAQVETGTGTFVAFATQPGNVSFDGAEEHSPFTTALLEHIETPGISISDMMIRVRTDVYEQTKQIQTPWDQSSLRSQFYFSPEGEGDEALTEEDRELLMSLDPELRKKFEQRFGLSIQSVEEEGTPEAPIYASIQPQVTIEASSDEEALPVAMAPVNPEPPVAPAPVAIIPSLMIASGDEEMTTDNMPESVPLPPTRPTAGFDKEVDMALLDPAEASRPLSGGTGPRLVAPEPVIAEPAAPAVVEPAEPAAAIAPPLEPALPDMTLLDPTPPVVAVEPAAPVAAEPSPSLNTPSNSVEPWQPAPLPPVTSAPAQAEAPAAEAKPVEPAPPVAASEPAVQVPETEAAKVEPGSTMPSNSLEPWPAAPLPAEAGASAQVEAPAMEAAPAQPVAPLVVPEPVPSTPAAVVTEAEPAVSPAMEAAATPVEPAPVAEAAATEPSVSAMAEIAEPKEELLALAEPSEPQVLSRAVSAAPEIELDPAPVVNAPVPASDSAAAKPADPALPVLIPAPQAEAKPPVALPAVEPAPVAEPEQKMAAIDPSEITPDLTIPLPKNEVAAAPDADLPRRIQQELARLGCYRSTVDGDWGSGSAKALLRYYATKKEAPENLDPDETLLAKLTLEETVVCTRTESVTKPPKPKSSTSKTVKSAPREPVAVSAPKGGKKPAGGGSRVAAGERQEKLKKGLSSGAFR